jgi:rare lipoprotein A
MSKLERDLLRATACGVLVVLLGAVGCASTKPGAGSGREEGIASYYADKFHGRRTANGETYDMYAMTAAHPTLPFNTRVKVTNLENNHRVFLRINDRGPFKKGRIIDVSYSAARKLGMIRNGTARVRVEVQ